MTEIDVASQRSIESTIMSNFPLHGFLGEESVEAGHCASVGMMNSSFLFCITVYQNLISGNANTVLYVHPAIHANLVHRDHKL